jgi:hypothetical protein
MTRLLCVLALLASCAAAQTVEGSVFDAATGTGVGGAKVELLKGATPFYETTTDGGGRYRIDDVKEGDYAVRYQSPDYWLTAGPSDYRIFHVAPGDPVKLEVRLMPWSKISGRVVDNRGNAVANARLELTGLGMVANGRTYTRTSWGGGGGAQLSASPLPMTFTGNSDAQGKFEVQLMPGAYELCVAPAPDLRPPNSEPDGPALAWKRTWYPGVVLPDSASKIVVLPGQASQVELKLLAVPAHAVRGVVLNPDGTPAPKVAIALGETFRSASVESKSDGTFEFPSLAEGEWRLSADAQASSVKLRAVQWIEVARHDVENVKLQLAPPVTARGRIVIDASKDEPPLKPGPLMLVLVGGRTRREGGQLAPGGGMVPLDTHGDSILQDIYPGVYRLGPQLQPPPPPYYLDSVRVGGADIASQEVEISSDVAISVVYKTDGGSVRGVVENCASGGVVLVPADPALRQAGFSKSAPCDSTGRYEVRAVRPGDYYAVALAGNGPVLAFNEASSLPDEASKVTVRTGQASSADLRAVTKPVF